MCVNNEKNEIPLCEFRRIQMMKKSRRDEEITYSIQ